MVKYRNRYTYWQLQAQWWRDITGNLQFQPIKQDQVTQSSLSMQALFKSRMRSTMSCVKSTIQWPRVVSMEKFDLYCISREYYQLILYWLAEVYDRSGFNMCRIKGHVWESTWTPVCNCCSFPHLFHAKQEQINLLHTDSFAQHLKSISRNTHNASYIFISHILVG